MDKNDIPGTSKKLRVASQAVRIIRPCRYRYAETCMLAVMRTRRYRMQNRGGGPCRVEPWNSDFFWPKFKHFGPFAPKFFWLFEQFLIILTMFTDFIRYCAVPNRGHGSGGGGGDPLHL